MSLLGKQIAMAFVIGIFTPLGLRKRDALRDVMLDRCAGGGARCWCRSAETCRFRRCVNCDMPTDELGIALLDDFGAEGIDFNAGPCPYCNGPMPKH